MLCCSEMKGFLKMRNTPISYNCIFREYYIDCPDTNNIITFSFCPWCAKKLPDSLRNLFFDILEVEYFLELSLDEVSDENVPKEFCSDEWWKKRGL